MGQTAPRRRSLPAEPGSITPGRSFRLRGPEMTRRPRSCAQVRGGGAKRGDLSSRVDRGSIPAAFAPGENPRVKKYQPKPFHRVAGGERIKNI